MSDDAQRTSDGLAYVCRHLDQIRADLAGDTSPLERVLDAVADGLDLTTALDALHTALLAGGDAFGLYGNAARTLRPPGVGREPLEIVYLCPLGRCSVLRWPEAVGGAQHCSISGRDRVREKL